MDNRGYSRSGIPKRGMSAPPREMGGPYLAGKQGPAARAFAHSLGRAGGRGMGRGEREEGGRVVRGSPGRAEGAGRGEGRRREPGWAGGMAAAGGGQGQREGAASAALAAAASAGLGGGAGERGDFNPALTRKR